MLSIENILKDNGIKINFYIKEEFLVVRINMYKMIFLYEDNLACLIEQACRQYVKENGFKLEWLPNIVDTYALKHNDFAREYMTPYVDENINKLIAWLYANDIEIKEVNNERKN